MNALHLADVFVYLQVMVEFQRPAIEIMIVNVSCLTLSPNATMQMFTNTEYKYNARCHS